MKASLRPFLPSDAPLLALIFQESIDVLTEDDYDLDQRAAWAGAGACTHRCPHYCLPQGRRRAG